MPTDDIRLMRGAESPPSTGGGGGGMDAVTTGDEQADDDGVASDWPTSDALGEEGGELRSSS